MRFAFRPGVDSFDGWADWRRRLDELRRALDAHLDAADALVAKASHTAAGEAMTAAAPAARLTGGRDRGARSAPASDAPDTSPAGWSPEVQRALAYLADHYDQAVSVPELARAIGCSRDRLTRLVRRETGLSVHAHLMRFRLARAARDVRAGDKIEAVMLGVGYRGKRNFYRQFKARFGATPGRWRRPEEGGAG